MGLQEGTKLGPYEVVSPLGEGGMGEVYRARDTKLNRDVALKVLPEAFASDPQRMARFEREAQVLASLNHPNIAIIHGLEESGQTRALVMELVEGQTLAERIGASAQPASGTRSGTVGARSRAPLQIDDTLAIAKQVAEALEYAHDRGIVHRDLKPANIKITPEGTVKVLDFGLAKAMGPDEISRDISNSPTLSAAMTQAGFILGTAAYMSPEQAKAKPVDRRCDIWAFGCVLYEMLSGKCAFCRADLTDTIVAVMKEEPDWDALPADTPLEIRKLLRRCLNKDSKRRLQAIGDARITIEEAMSGESDVGAQRAAPLPEAAAPLRRILPWALTAIFAAVALVAIVFLWKSAVPAPQFPMHFSAITNFAGVQAEPAISPDGRSVAFVSNRDGHYNIYVTLVHGGSLVQITHDPNEESFPSWSPDGTTLAYSRLNAWGHWDIWEVPALGGTPRRVILNAAEPAWSPDGHSLAYLNTSDQEIWISSVSGENAHRAVPPQQWPNYPFSMKPSFSPDGTELAFVVHGYGPYGHLAVANLASGKARQLTHRHAVVTSPSWSADGKSIYFASSRGGTINIWKIAATGGEPEQITVGEGDDLDLDVSKDGKRIVFGTRRLKIGISRLDLQARPGEQSVKVLTADPARNQNAPAYSPDGKHLAYFTNLKGAENEEIWVSDADGQNAAPLVKDSQYNVFPSWTPDGKSIVYWSAGKNGNEDRIVPLTGGAPQTLTSMPFTPFPDVGRDGQVLDLVALTHKVDEFDLRTRKVQKLGALQTGVNFAKWSPDEHSVAYVVRPTKQDDPKAGLWVTDFKNPPRQIFHGWILWFARGPGNEIYLLEGKPNLEGVLWKVNWNGRGLTGTRWTLPLSPGLDKNLGTTFDVSPDGHYMAFQTDQVLQENIGMIENVR